MYSPIQTLSVVTHIRLRDNINPLKYICLLYEGLAVVTMKNTVL
jgi:hypothetical protein